MAGSVESDATMTLAPAATDNPFKRRKVITIFRPILNILVYSKLLLAHGDA